jgi:cyclophilin family peptidyl-prolyl cis-trans isomerase
MLTLWPRKKPSYPMLFVRSPLEVEIGNDTHTVMFELLDTVAPQTVANFVENCAAGAYKGVAFHRAIGNYLVQTGDPLTTDDSRRSEWGTGGGDKTVPGEFKGHHTVGAVAMARRGDKVNPSRASNGYQFYFTLGAASNLDGNYTVFGQVVSGLETLQSISNVPVDSNDCPLTRVEVKGIRIVNQKGPLIVMRDTSGKRRYTKPTGARSGWERMLERIW